MCNVEAWGKSFPGREENKDGVNDSSHKTEMTEVTMLPPDLELWYRLYCHPITGAQTWDRQVLPSLLLTWFRKALVVNNIAYALVEIITG